MPFIDKIDRIFSDFDRPDKPGVSAAVIRDGEVLLAKGYGSAQLEYEIPVTAETRFHVASVSKQFTAFAVLLLEDRGALGLDDPIRDHLPWLPELPHPISIRQMVSHTSGIRDQWDLLTMAGWRLDDVITMDDIRALMSQQKDLNFVPQERLLYSNMGYTLLADIVAAGASQSFAEFTRQEIFEPLGMADSHFHDDHQRIVPDRAYSYEPSRSGSWRKSVLNFANVGATGLFSTPTDLVRWLDNFRSHIVGNNRVFQGLVEVPTLTSGEEARMHNSGYAGGVMIGTYRGLRTIGHGGSDAGFRSDCQWFPDQRTGIVVLGNSADCKVAHYLHRLADIVLEDVLQQPSESRIPDASHRPLDQELLDSYAGKYDIGELGLMTLTAQQDSMTAQLTGVREFTITPVNENRFYADAIEGYIEFQRRTDDLSCTVVVESPFLKASGSQIPDSTLRETNLDDLCGTYFSTELRVFWDVMRDDKGLLIRHFRHGDVRLTPTPRNAKEGTRRFLGDQHFAVLVDFSCDGGRIFMRVSTSRAKHVLFEQSPISNKGEMV